MADETKSMGPLAGPFPRRVVKTSDVEGVTLTLPSSMGMLRINIWLCLIMTQLALYFSQTDVPLLALLLSTLVSGFVIERFFLMLANGVSRGAQGAKWFMWGMFALLLFPTVVASGFDVLAMLASVFLWSCLTTGFSFLSGRAPTVRINDRMLRMCEWRPVGFKRSGDAVRDGANQLLTIPLEDIASVTSVASRNPWKGRVVLTVTDRDVPLWCGPLRSKEREWLTTFISQRVAHRKETLLREGHDLEDEAVIPPVLQGLRAKS